MIFTYVSVLDQKIVIKVILISFDDYAIFGLVIICDFFFEGNTRKS